MKFFILLFFTTLILFGSCKNNSQNKNNSDSTKTEKIDTNNLDTIKTKVISAQQQTLGKEFTSKYICPMHCKGSGSDKPGTCPVCGMEYILNPDYQPKK